MNKIEKDILQAVGDVVSGDFLEAWEALETTLEKAAEAAYVAEEEGGGAEYQGVRSTISIVEDWADGFYKKLSKIGGAG